MRGQRAALGLYAAEVVPGATVRVSHFTKGACLLRELCINHPDTWEMCGLRVESRRLELGERHVREDVGYWEVLPPERQRIAVANCSIYLDLKNLRDEPHTVQALVWAVLW
ncbi:MAG TPA: hypothetical protein VJN18_11105 [Polyangiaceae bacterium]|nr:hypothetical protein [Polyangiaceae bacterium]